MKFTVFHVFSGSKSALTKNSGGVETFLNTLSRSKEVNCVFCARKHQVIPDIIYGPIRDEVFSGVSVSTNFPFLLYLISNLVLGAATSVILSIYALSQKAGGRKIVIHTHDPVIGASLFMFSPKTITQAIYVAQFHSEYVKRLKIMLPKTQLSKLTCLLYRFSEKIVTKRASFVISVNSNISCYLNELGCPGRKIRQIPIFLDLKKANNIQPSTSLAILKSNKFKITYIGRLSKEKNLEVLLDAFYRLPSTVQESSLLLVVGTGYQLDQFREVAKSAKNIVFLGHRRDVNAILAFSEVFVLPSLTEGFPFSLLEAMGSRKAIIASDIAPIREVVRNGFDVILFDPNDAQALSEAIMRFYSDDNLRRQFGDNARLTALQYDISCVLPKLLSTYEEFLRFKQL